MPMLREAQAAIAAGDHARAAIIFTNIRSTFPQIHIALPLLSRAICYLEMGEYAKGIQDCDEVMSVPDTQIPPDIVVGCNTSHAAASGLLAKLHKQSGQEGLSEMHLRAMRQKQQEAVANVQEAVHIKERGNELFKAGRLQDAAEAYERSAQLDPTSEIIWSNLSLVYAKLNKLDRAEAAARQSTVIKPSYAKGWFRLGQALMAGKKYPEAMAAFQTGLKYAPEDAELKSKYIEAATHAEKDGFEQKLMSMMIDLARDSFDVREWWRSYSSLADFVDPTDSWSQSWAPKIDSDTVKPVILSALKAGYPEAQIFTDDDKTTPKGPSSVVSNGDFTFDRLDMKSYIHHSLFANPIVAATYLLPLVKEAEPKGDWHVVISFNYKPPKGAEESSQLYTALVDKKKMRVFDWQGLALDQRNAMGKGKMSSDREMNGRMFRALVESVDTDKIIYTTGDAKFLSEFCEEFWAAERRAPGLTKPSSGTTDEEGASNGAALKAKKVPQPTIWDQLDNLLKPDNLLVIFGAIAVLLAIYIAVSASWSSPAPAAEPAATAAAE